MAGMRIRCDCGTVYDPQGRANCPGCGAARVDASLSQVRSDEAVQPSRVPGGSQHEPPSAKTMGATGTAGVAQRHATAIAGIGGIAVLMLIALLIREFSSPKSETKSSSPMSEAIVSTNSEQSTEPESEAESPAADPAAGVVIPAQPQRRPPAPPSDIAKFKGEWTLLTARMQPEAVIPGLPVTRSILAHTVTSAFAGTGAVSTLRISDAGSYVIEVDVTGNGQFTSNIAPEKHLLSVAAQGALTFSPSGVEVSDRARAMLKPVRFDVPQMDVKANDTELTLLPFGATSGATSTWFRPGDSGLEHGQVHGTWTYPQVFVDSYIPYRGTLELRESGDYRVRFTRSEQGLLTAADGEYEFKRAINMGPPVQGRYEFDGENRFTLTEPRGSATWVRAAGSGRPPSANRPPMRGVRK